MWNISRLWYPPFLSAYGQTQSDTHGNQFPEDNVSLSHNFKALSNKLLLLNCCIQIIRPYRRSSVELRARLGTNHFNILGIQSTSFTPGWISHAKSYDLTLIISRPELCRKWVSEWMYSIYVCMHIQVRCLNPTKLSTKTMHRKSGKCRFSTKLKT